MSSEEICDHTISSKFRIATDDNDCGVHLLKEIGKESRDSNLLLVNPWSTSESI